MKGFTLVEMMVALLIFGILAAAGVMVMRSSIDSQMAVRTRVDGIGAFQRLRATMKADIGQAADRRTRAADGSTQPAFVGGVRSGRPLLALVRRGWENPDRQPRPSLQYVEYRVTDGRLERQVRTGLDGGVLRAPQVLAEGVQAASIAFYGREAWRPEWDGTERMPEAVRLGFLRKVFGILTLQLGLSIGVIFLCMSSVRVHTWLRRDPTVIWLCVFLAVTCMLALVCVGPARRWYPVNLILLSSYVRPPSVSRVGVRVWRRRALIP